MGVPQIRVGALHVRAGDPDRVVPFRNDLEDALRTASLPFGPNAVLRIRRLDLGRVPAGLTRQALSRLIAQRLARIDPVGAEPGRPLPASLEAVVFRDWVALAALALDAALGSAPAHWALEQSFPALAAPDAATRVAGVVERLIATSGPAAPGRLAATEAGLARLAAALATLAGPHHVAILATLACGPAVLDRLVPFEVEGSPADAARRHAVPSAPRREIGPPDGEAGPFDDAPAMLRRAFAEGQRRWGRRHPALVTLTALVARALVGEPGQRAALDRLIAWQSQPSARPARAPDRQTARETKAPAARGGGAGTGKEPRRTESLGPQSERAPDRVPEPPHALDAPPDPRGLATPLAGFWLLLAALRHAGAAELDRAFALPLGLAALQAFAARIELGETDPGFAALGPGWAFWAEELPPAEGAAVPEPALLQRLIGRRAPWIARHGPARALLGVAPGLPTAVLDAAALARVRRISPQARRVTIDRPRVADLVNGLMLTCQRLAWLATGKGWREIAATPGYLQLTATHLDVTFDARDLDIGVRLAGFDIDPGWLPWLGRVVSFHYDYAQLRDHVRARGEETR